MNDCSREKCKMKNVYLIYSSKRMKPQHLHCVKSVRVRTYSDPHFPAFGLTYRVSLRIQSECGKMWTRITPNTDIFHAVLNKSRLHLNKNGSRMFGSAFFGGICIIIALLYCGVRTCLFMISLEVKNII